MSKFIVQVGSSNSDVTLVETVASSRKLVESKDVYTAHKSAFFDCYPGQEVLQIEDTNGRVLYTLKDGFIK